jgi:hypothetical protein
MTWWIWFTYVWRSLYDVAVRCLFKSWHQLTQSRKQLPELWHVPCLFNRLACSVVEIRVKTCTPVLSRPTYVLSQSLQGAVFLKKLIVAQLANIFLAFIVLDGSLSCLKERDPGPYLSQIIQSTPSQLITLRTIFENSFIYVRSQVVSFIQIFRLNLCVFLIPPVSSTCLSHLIHLDFITLNLVLYGNYEAPFIFLMKELK